MIAVHAWFVRMYRDAQAEIYLFCKFNYYLRMAAERSCPGTIFQYEYAVEAIKSSQVIPPNIALGLSFQRCFQGPVFEPMQVHLWPEAKKSDVVCVVECGIEKEEQMTQRTTIVSGDM